MSIGGKGVVSVVANLVPKDMKALVKAFNDGRLEDARTLHRKLFNLCKDLLGVATNPIPVKTAMRLLGRDTGEVRLPLFQLDEPGVNKVSQSLKAYGLL